MFIILAIAFSYHQNSVLSVTEIDVQSDELPESFDGYRIVHLSDLHSKTFGENQSRLVEQVKNENPDLIVFTGDLIDKRDFNKEPGITLLKKMVSIAPTYFVTGNHELLSEDYPSLEKDLESVGVTVLSNTAETIQWNGDTITIMGVGDPVNAGDANAQKDAVSQSIRSMETISDFTILLSHRPELFSIYQDNQIDVTFTGHAHGGQFRLPFAGGLVAPNQGFFPKYAAGKYAENGSVMIVSRGLGNSIIPQRLFNRPEVVSVTLSAE
ncbi:metallophosphoesterase [Virgibacillus doumboii]|uniref:metallophosphoesterase n=1 Tax=Virgibacillus doumboii TaxID=2697503 RepID=UPI0013DF4DC7|nr:metallophosphoesterase [Virgibacillus doumboii]